MRKRIRLKFSFGLFVFMVTVCFSQTALMGQDTIIKRNNEKIIGKVIEINLNELKLALAGCFLSGNDKLPYKCLILTSRQAIESLV